MRLDWLFGKKKVLPKVPLPGGRPFDERTFQFSRKFSGETLIEPEKLQAAAGLNRFPSLSEEGEAPRAPEKPLEMLPSSAPEMPAASRFSSEPVYIKVDVYQHVLGELDGLKLDLTKLQEINRHLESSEYNEESNFEKLKKCMRLIHDRLLQVDKGLFKYQGE